jgi:uncharacterized membrane protein YhaH (DUF805 family)
MTSTLASRIDPPDVRMGPVRFFALGVFLFAIKFALDRFVARVGFSRDWSILNYLIPNEAYALPALPPSDRRFFLTMLAIALPFVAIGILVTLRRLRDAGLSRWLTPLFFVPAVNLLFFAVLSVLPTVRRREPQPEPTTNPLPVPAIPLDYGTDAPMPGWLGRIIPQGSFASAAVAVLLPAPIAVGATLLAANVMRDYGLGLFVGMPFVIGMVSVVLFGFRTPRGLGSCIGIGLLSAAVSGLALLGFAIEGLGCMVMLLPLALPFAALGAAVGYCIQSRPARGPGSPRSLFGVTMVLPAMLLAEGSAQPPAPVRPVTTCIDVAAPPSVVWTNIVTFDRIDAPPDWIFRAGVAYPVRARIEGSGRGAVRYCEFSTGPFVEPIDVWDEPRLLKFAVTSNPPPMREVSPFHIHPPHLSNFLLSHGGQFKLIELPNGSTRIEGTTWYENRMWPQAYWRAWSDFLIHRIHRRVLVHIRELSERS